MSPDDFESLFIKAVKVKQSKGLRQKRQDLATGVYTGPPRLRQRSHSNRSEPSWLHGLRRGSYRGKRRSLGDRFRGLTWDELPVPTVPLVASLKGPLELRKKRAKIHS